MSKDLRPCGVEIQLDKPRKLLFSFLGLSILAEEFGSVDEALEQMGKTFGGKMDVAFFKNITIFLQAGLVHEEEDLTTKEISKHIHLGNMQYCVQKINQAIEESLPQPDPNE